MTQTEGLYAKAGADGVPVLPYSRQFGGVVYFRKLLQFPVELLKSLWTKNETALLVGQTPVRRARHTHSWGGWELWAKQGQRGPDLTVSDQKPRPLT